MILCWRLQRKVQFLSTVSSDCDEFTSHIFGVISLVKALTQAQWFLTQASGPLVKGHEINLRGSRWDQISSLVLSVWRFQVLPVSSSVCPTIINIRAPVSITINSCKLIQIHILFHICWIQT